MALVGGSGSLLVALAHYVSLWVAIARSFLCLELPVKGLRWLVYNNE